MARAVLDFMLLYIKGLVGDEMLEQHQMPKFSVTSSGPWKEWAIDGSATVGGQFGEIYCDAELTKQVHRAIYVELSSQSRSLGPSPLSIWLFAPIFAGRHQQFRNFTFLKWCAMPSILRKKRLLQVKMARPGRLELPTLCLEGRRSIQLSYGRMFGYSLILLKLKHQFDNRLFRNLGAFGAIWSI